MGKKIQFGARPYQKYALYEETLDLIVNRPLIVHLSLYTRLKPTCDKKIEIVGLVLTFLINELSTAEREVPSSNPGGSFILKFFSLFNCNKKMIEILMKIGAKITIIVVENREPYYYLWM